MKSRKLPPFGKLLVDRQNSNNPPWLVAVCVGGDAWNSAKSRNQRGDSVGLVLPAGENPCGFVWPVNGCLVVIEWSHGPSAEHVVELARALLRAGVESVTIWPRWVDYTNPHLDWPADQPAIKTYRVDRAQGSANAA